MITRILHRIVSNPTVYDWIQAAAGADAVGRFLAPHLAQSAGKLLLDVGAGTGNYREFMPDSTRYIWMDTDAQKLSGFRSKQKPEMAAMGDGTKLCFRDKSIDYALCAAVLHHLNDGQLGLLADELARVVRHRLIVLDPVQCSNRTISNLLWKYDRGSFPRTAERIQIALKGRFNLEHVGDLTIYHKYTLCVAQPKT